MSHIHFFAIPNTHIKVEDLERVLSTKICKEGYVPIQLSKEQTELLNGAMNESSWRVTIFGVSFPRDRVSADDWIIYSIEVSKNYVFVVPIYNRMNVDLNFGEVALYLSKVLGQKVYYIWKDHASDGYELFDSGEKIKSIEVDTHGPGIKIDGRELSEEEIKTKGSTLNSHNGSFGEEIFPNELVYQAASNLAGKYRELNEGSRNYFFHRSTLNVEKYFTVLGKKNQ